MGFAAYRIGTDEVVHVFEPAREVCIVVLAGAELLVRTLRDEAIRLRNRGLSWRAIAKKLEVPVTTVVDACRCSEIAVPESPNSGGKAKGKRKAA